MFRVKCLTQGGSLLATAEFATRAEALAFAQKVVERHGNYTIDDLGGCDGAACGEV